MRVLVSGYYGFGNVGDDAVLQAIIKGLRRSEPKIEITVLSAVPQLTKELEQVEAVDRFRWPKVLARMLRTNVFISGGGTLFQNSTSNRSLLYYLSLIVLAKVLFKKVVVFGQGFGPLRGRFYRILTRLILNRVNLITVRDRDSYEQLRKLGVKRPGMFLTADPTAILRIAEGNRGRRLLSLEAVKYQKPMLGIAVRSFPHKNKHKFYPALSQAIDWLATTHNFSPVFVLFHCPEDMAETSKLINQLAGKSNVIFKMCRPREMLSLISQFDLVIGMRLHSLIFAAMSSVPMLGLAYDPKVEAFMRSIGQPCLKIGDDPDHHKVKAALQEILTNRARIKADLDVKAKELRDRADQNFKLFFDHFRPQTKPRKVKK